MEAAKALFEVQAGIVPGRAMPELTKRWGYTASDYEKDIETPAGQQTIFSQRLQEAHSYAMELANPKYLNWVRVDWIWV